MSEVARQVAHHDARTLFERAWSHAVREGTLRPDRREALLAEGTRGIRRIAGVLGSEHLREDLERAMRSMLALVNLHLHKVSSGDLEAAVRSLCDNGVLYHTKGASQAIKRVIASEIGEEFESLDDATRRGIEEQVVADWAFMPFAEFAGRERGADERRRRRGAARAISALLDGYAPDSYYEPEQVILTALLVLGWSPQRAWVADLKGFERLLAAVREAPDRLAALPDRITGPYRPIIEAVWREQSPGLLAAITDPHTPLHRLAAGDPQTNPINPWLVIPDTALGEIDAAEANTTEHWLALTGGRTDEAHLMFTLLQGVLGLRLKLPLGVKAAETLLKKTCAERPDERLLREWLDANAPHPHHDGLEALWDTFWTDRDEMLGEASGAAACKAFAAEWLPVKQA